MSSSKSAALQQQYLEDERKSYFLVKHPRGQKVALIDRVLQPLSQPSKLDGTTINFKIAKVNHMVDALTLMFDCVVTRSLMERLGGEGGLYSDSFSLVDLPAIRAIDEIQVQYGGDVMNKFNSDAIRWDMHLFKTDAQKTAMRQAATDYSKPFVCKDMRLPEQTGYEAYAFSFRGARGMDYLRPRDIDTGHLSFSPMSFKVSDIGNNTNINGNAMQPVSRFGTSTSSIELYENAIPPPFDSDEFGVGTNNVNFGTIYGIATSFYGHSSVAPASRTFGSYALTTSALTEDIVLHWEVELPWTHGMSPDRNLPVVLLDNEPQIQVKFKETSKLIWAVSSGVGSSGQTLLLSLKGNTQQPYIIGAPLLQSDFTTDKLYMTNARLRVSYREQSAALINALGSEPSITYPLSSYQSERYSLNPGSYTTSDIPINSIRGLVHTIGFAVRDQNSVTGCPNLHGNSFNVRWMTMAETGLFRDIGVTHTALLSVSGIGFKHDTAVNLAMGYYDQGSFTNSVGVEIAPVTVNSMDTFRQAYDSARRYFGSVAMNSVAVALMHPNPSPVLLYDYDFLDMSSVQTDCYAGSRLVHNKVVMPGGQRMVEEWWIEANGERITGKEPINALYGLTTYKTKHFPAHTELARHYAGDMHGNNEAAPCGLNLHVWTFGMDGDRAAVGSGTLNFDGLQSVKLHIKWYDNSSPVAAIAPTSIQLSSQAPTTALLSNATKSASDLKVSYATQSVGSLLNGQCLGFPGVDNNTVPVFYKKNGRFAQEQLFIDMFAFGANFTTISGGNWFRQLTL